MKIGYLSERIGIPVETIRFYESEGLLPAPRRSESNYRIYEFAHEARLLFIKNCRNLDMTLNEIRSLLILKDSPEHRCDEVAAVIDEHITHVSTRMAQLKELQEQLMVLRVQCQSKDTDSLCGIIDSLSQTSSITDITKNLPQSHLSAIHKKGYC